MINNDIKKKKNNKKRQREREKKTNRKDMGKTNVDKLGVKIVFSKRSTTGCLQADV